MANENNKIKLLLLWDILSKNTDETHHLNTDEIIKMLADKGINVSRKILSQDIAPLNDSGYEILSYKKKYYYYYVVNRPFDTAEIVMLSDVVKDSKLTPTQKNMVIDKLFSMLCSGIAAENCEVAFFNLNLLFNENNASEGWYIKLLNNSLRVFAQKNLALSNRIFCTTPKSVRGRYFCACNNNITKKLNCEKTIDKAFCLRIISKKEVT